MQKSRTFRSEKEKESILRRVVNRHPSKTVRETAKELGVPYKTIDNWLCKMSIADIEKLKIKPIDKGRVNSVNGQ